MKKKVLFLILSLSAFLIFANAQTVWNFTSGMDGWHDLGAGRDVSASWETGKLKMTYIDGGNPGTQLGFPAIQVDNLNFNAADYKYLQINYETVNWPTASPVKMLVTLTKTDNSVVYSYFDIDPTKNFLSIDIQANNPGWAQAYSGTIKSVQLELPHNGDAASTTATNWYSASTLIDRIQFSNYKTTAWDFKTTTEGWGSYGGDLTLSNTGDGNLTLSHSTPSDGTLDYTAIYNDTPVDVSNIDLFYMKFTATNWPKTSALVNIVFEMGGTYYANKILNVSSGELSFNIRTENQNNWNPLPSTGTTARIRIEIPHNSELTGFNWASASIKIDRIAFSKNSDKTEAIVSSDANLSSFVKSSSTEVFVNTGSTLTIDETAMLKSIVTSSGGKVTIATGNTLTATNGITLQSDATGTATLLNSGTYTGTLTAQQYLGTARNWYVSSPVQVTNSPANNITRYYEYVEAGNNDPSGQPTGSTVYWKGLSTGTSMTVGKGYISQANAETTVSFTGTPNNGNITTSFNLTRDDAKGKGFNLVGNPYPSYIDWSLVAGANTNLMSTAWFKTKKTDNSYTFASVNVATPSSPEIVSNSANTTITKYIPPMQAFWVRVKSGTASTSMSFTNAMREHRLNNGDLMKTPKLNERMRLRLQLINGTETDETLLYFDANATNDYNDYDSPKMMNSSETTPDLYSKAGNERLVINGMNAITDNLELPLGFSLNAAATLKLKATQLSNFPEGTKVFLLDKESPTPTELLPETEYSFTTTAPTTNNESRFSLLFKMSGASTGVNKVDKENISVFVNAQNEIVINANAGSKYAIYNAVGQQIANGALNYKLQTINYKLKNGVYVVKVGNQSTRVIIK